jgi:uncharacterized membrane protein YfcA
MAVAMVLGAFIAGSTPLGGGVVAFPVSVLVLNLSPKEGRDFTSFIQSFGMTSAAFLLFTCKREMLHFELIIITVLAGTWGLVIGFSITVSPLAVNVVFTTLDFSFALVYFYLNEYYEPRADAAAQARKSESEANGDKYTNPTPQRIVILRRVILVLMAIGGGVLTAQVSFGTY